MALAAWKYPLRTEDEQTVFMPAGARVIHADLQAGAFCLWALVDPSAPEVGRRFRVAGTGHPIEHEPRQLEHVGSFLINGGALVFHVFEVFADRKYLEGTMRAEA